MPEPESLQPSDTVDHPSSPEPASLDTAEATTGNLFSVDDDALAPIPPLPMIPGYEVFGELGRGGMGVVYKARQVALGRLVALKMIVTGGHAGPEERRRFKTEAEAAARLSHPNIVQVYEVGEHAGCPFVALEFCDGDSLKRRLDGTPWPPRAAAELVQTLARAIHVAHEAGIVHRDLKPANVLLAGGGLRPPVAVPPKGGSRPPPANAVPKIADFGLAKKLDADEGQTTTGAILGTPSYMAPEQASGRADAIGPRTDVASLGAILYELLVGRPPFKGATLVETVEQVRTQEPVAPRLLQPKVPRDLETITLKCLHKEPARRYTNALELADDLRRFLAGEPIRARPVGAAERLWRWVKRNPAPAGLVSAVALLLLAVTGVSFGAYLTVRQKNAAIVAEAEEKERQRQAAEAARALADARLQRSRAANDLFVNQVQARLEDDLYATRARKRLAETAVAELEKRLAPDGDASGASERARMGAHLKAGDLAYAAGEPERAAKHYRQTHALAKALHDAQPESDLAAGNYALALTRMARVAVIGKDPKQARHYVLQALDLQRKLVDSPKSRELPPDETRLSLAGTHEMLGQHQRAYELRREALQRKATDRAREALSESCIRLANASADLSRKRAFFKECIELRSALLVRSPETPRYQRLLADALATLGDLELFAGDASEAGKLYDRHLALFRKLAGPDDVLAAQRLLGQAYYRRATAALRRGDVTASAHDYAECLRQWELFARERPGVASAENALMLARARCGQHEKAAERAAVLQRTAGKNVRVLFQAACGYALCSAAAGQETAPGKEYRAKALGVLREMIAAGYRDRAELERDPDLDPIRDDAAFREVLAGLK